MEVVLSICLGVVVLPWEPQIDACVATRDGTRRPECFCYGLPACCSIAGGRQHPCAQMIRMQIVVLGVGIGQAVGVRIGLPGGVGAPCAFGMPPICLGDLATVTCLSAAL